MALGRWPNAPCSGSWPLGERASCLGHDDDAADDDDDDVDDDAADDDDDDDVDDDDDDDTDNDGADIAAIPHRE